MAANFRSYLDALKKNDELTVISKSTDLRDVAALVPQSNKALLFTNVRGYAMPVASGLLQSRTRIAIGMGVPYEQIEAKLRYAMEHTVKANGAQRAAVINSIIEKDTLPRY